jgi:hypothetical protein
MIVICLHDAKPSTMVRISPMISRGRSSAVILILFLPEWTGIWTSFLIVLMDELSQLSLSYQGFNLLLQDVIVFCSVAMVSVEMTVEVLRPFRRVRTKFPKPLECGIVLYL